MSVKTEKNLFDNIATLLPEEHREGYYRHLLHFKKLSPDDDLLIIAEAMGYLALITRETPKLITSEREKLADILRETLERLESTQLSTRSYQDQLEARLGSISSEIVQKIDPGAIARQIGANLSERLENYNLGQIAVAVGTASEDLATSTKRLKETIEDLSHPKAGALGKTQAAIQQMEAQYSKMMRSITSETEHLQHNLRKITLFFALLCGVVGFVLGLGLGVWGR